MSKWSKLKTLNKVVKKEGEDEDEEEEGVSLSSKTIQNVKSVFRPFMKFWSFPTRNTSLSS